MQCPRCATEVKDGAKFCPACGAGVPSWTGRLVRGDVLINRYHVVRPLARGGMGSVYLATDSRLGDAPVALKEMTLSHAPGDTKAWEQAVVEFRREAAMMARLSHPNLPRVIDQFQHEDNQFLVMEYVEGRTLRAELEQHTAPLPLPTALHWFRQLANVLGYLHTQEPPIIYRDLKPTNIMIRPDSRIALIDFGIARLYKPGQSGDTAIYGTPGYAPPEQYGLGQTDARSDIYSMAMVLHEVLTGYDPGRRTTTRPPLANTLRADVPNHIAQAIHRALAVDSADRFDSMREFAAAVEPDGAADVVASRPFMAQGQRPAAPAPPTIAMQPPTKRRRLFVALGGLGAVGLMLVLGLLFVRNQSAPNPTATPNVLGRSVTAEPNTIMPNTPVANPPTPIPPTPVIGPAPPGMATIASGTYVLGSADGPPDEQPTGPVYVRTFYLDRTEVTVAAYRACVETGRCTAPVDLAALTHASYFNDPAFDQFPVINVTWEQARTYCATQNRRLPTELEWETAARGTAGRVYPWGDDWDTRKLNVWGSGQNGDVLAVGSFAAGATPEGGLDLAGNVAEWTSSLDQPYPYNPNDGRELPNQPGSRIVRGSFSGDDPTSARLMDRERRPPTEFANNLGFRCATNEAYLPVGMDLIPAGTWTLGATITEAEALKARFNWPSLLNEQPTTVITSPSFYLDHTEVTNAAYAEFVSATGHPAPKNPFDPIGLAVWNADGTIPVTRTDHPVVNVTWADATAYCQWAGKRLPTEAEWERAARGDTRRVWPWGDDWDGAKANTNESGRGTTEAVGTLANAGTYGSLDLAGNVWEWTSSLYLPYPYRADDGREAASGGGARVLRGGSWLDDQFGSHSSGRNSLLPTLANVNVGFRCAQDVPK